MVEFIFKHPNNSINVVVKTDLIGIEADQTGPQNFNIVDIQGVETDEELRMFGPIQKLPSSIRTLKQHANINGLQLMAKEVGKYKAADAPEIVLVHFDTSDSDSE